MKGFLFYLEYPNKTEKHKGTRKNLGNHKGTCVGVILDENNNRLWQGNSLNMDAITGVFDKPNSDCCFGGVGREYLDERCKRISEIQAKEIHPKLFDYINQ